jgi:hypothetical protein
MQFKELQLGVEANGFKRHLSGMWMPSFAEEDPGQTLQWKMTELAELWGRIQRLNTTSETFNQGASEARVSIVFVDFSQHHDLDLDQGQLEAFCKAPEHVSPSLPFTNLRASASNARGGDTVVRSKGQLWKRPEGGCNAFYAGWF